MPKSNKKLTDKEKKKIYNLKHSIRKLGYKSASLDSKLSKIHTARQYSNLFNRLNTDLFLARLERDKKTNKKRYFDKAMPYYSYKDPVKYAKLRREYVKEFYPTEYKATKKQLDKDVSKAIEKQLKSNYIVTKQGVRLSKLQRKEFYEYRNRYNRKVDKLMKDLRQNDPKLYDYLHGNIPKDLMSGKMDSDEQYQFTEKNRMKVDYFKDKSEFNQELLKFARFLNSDMDFNQWAKNKKHQVFQIFEYGKYKDVNNSIMAKIKDKALNMDMQTFQMWYSNNKDRIQGLYDMARYGSPSSVQDLERELENILTEIDQYSEITTDYYGY